MNLTPEALDRHHYAEMLRSLRKFQEGSETLHGLIENLETHVGQLRAVDESWKNEFDGLVSDLEYTFDHGVERQSGLTNTEYRRVISVVEDLDSMVLGAREWTDLEKQALQKIIETQRPELHGDVELGLESGFTPKQVREIRDAIADERSENGMTNGEINEWGKMCDDFIERIGPPIR
ncbi:MAG TPA: hypothetical protein VGW96_03065 [Candidatus Eremiobacteraceae bacterium]|nr:hypothetical protein [Candidatus Eremiobacteraceae bacterium]